MSLHIVLIGPGLMSIPPKGWGAVETVIDNLARNLEAIGHRVSIVNIPFRRDALQALIQCKPDLIWLHYDVYIDWFKVPVPGTDCPIWLTGHFAYLSQYGRGNLRLLQYFLLISYLPASLWRLICLPLKLLGHRQYSMAAYLRVLASTQGIQNKGSVLANCAREDRIRFDPAGGNGRAICLGKIEPRKAQIRLIHIHEIDFIGPIHDRRFPKDHQHHRGSWTREQVERHLTDYSVLVLLSDGEAHALVICEALLAGLSVLVSEAASAHLSADLPFVQILPFSHCQNPGRVNAAMQLLIKSAVKYRQAARAYGLAYFSCEAQQRKLKELVGDA